MEVRRERIRVKLWRYFMKVTIKGLDVEME